MTITHERDLPHDPLPHDPAADPVDILVVEDNPAQARQLARLLRAEPGYAVRVAADGHAALEAVQRRRPDLVISDIAMPRMDGLTLCRTLKADPARAAIPVLLLARAGTLHDIVRGLDAGADGFVRKPYGPDQLRARLRRILVEGRDGAAAPAPEVMAAERRQAYGLLASTYDDALRTNAALADRQAGLERSCRTLGVLGAIAGALNEAVTEQAVAQVALEQLARLPLCSAAAVSVFGPDGEPRLMAADAIVAAHQGGIAGTVGSVAGAGAEGCRSQGRSGAGCGSACLPVGQAWDSCLCLPLATAESNIGTLHLRTEGELAADETALLENVARQLALALERARLYTRLETLVVERTEALRSERNRLSAMVETTAALVLLTDAQGRIVMFNRACEEALGWRAQDAIGRPCWEVVQRADDRSAVRRMFEDLPGGHLPARLQGEWRTRDGRTRSIIWRNTRIERADGSLEYVLGTGIDATELRGAEERLRYISNFDTLTGLPNRLLLRERMRQMKEQARAGGQLLGFMLLRFARMGLIRETLGPLAEQALYQQVGARLREIGGADAVARFSDGGFVLAALRPTSEGLAAAARRLLAALGAPYAHEGEELHLDPSVGIAVFPNDGLRYDGLVRCAEAALRQAFDGVGQRYAFYRPELNQGANDRFKMENGLRRAVDRGELVLHYQPQVDLASGAIVGAEALLRWNHPERGLVYPGCFIGLAEESGLILPIGASALMSACAQIREWQQAGLPVVPVSVNLSAHQFSDQIVSTVKSILDAYGVDPCLLELELTESASMADAGKSFELLGQLKAMGIRLAIDDFGTGYSNLNYLKRFPVDKLKLDKSFVDDIENNADDLAISRAVIGMAHGLRLTVVAEGVENAGQLGLLTELGCDLVQGYHFSRPVPAEDFARMLREGGRLGPGAGNA
ncbi:EAL domain-containing protein [Massilia forsythiae]|uniref:EAL domain-containing protein n=1 Tax=Massilia forsythiae TaxID=2728020 RepID=A0A7Z2ZUB6_9BURK|nr:EAL domain-containing protein [Massilia forsythiae]QJE02259.1 EAL domain-containing protein [Massilia forsythiae]